MERIDVKNGVGGFVLIKSDKDGPFVYAAQALRYQKSFHMAAALDLLLAVACAILAAYIVFHKHDPQPPVQKVSEEEYRQVLQEVEQLRASKVTDQRKIADLLAIRKNYEAQLKTQNANNAKLVQQLKDLQVSVPAQPIILEAIRKEASTPQGFRQAVDRAFGNGMGARIKVVNE